MSEQTQVRRWQMIGDAKAEINRVTADPVLEAGEIIEVAELAPIVEGLRRIANPYSRETESRKIARALLSSLSPTDEQTRPQGGER